MRTIWAAISVQIINSKGVIYYFEVIGRDKAIRIKNNKVIAFCPFKSKITGKALALVGLFKVTNIKIRVKAVYNSFGIINGAILNYQNLKLFISLEYKGLQQFFNFLRTV